MSTFQIINGLNRIHEFKDLHVEDPEVKKRGSVALILRFPGLDIPEGGASLTDLLKLVDELETGSTATSAEVLFIKRSSRVGDNWSGHVALPGGKGDPEDESDLATAIRETDEEIGLDLTDPSGAMYVGPLDQRLVKTSWGRLTLMTLCTYVFIVNGGPRSAKLTLQPSEIDRTFWIPVPHLYGKEAGTAGYEVVPMGQRLRLHQRPIIPRFLHPFITKFFVGNMLFGCTNLVYPRDMVTTLPNGPNPPYKLWGLTLGIMIDFLEILRPRTETLHFLYPTFQSPDFRLILWALTSKLRREKAEHFKSISVHQEGQMDLAGYALKDYFGHFATAIGVGVLFRIGGLSFLSYKLFNFILNRRR